MSTAPIFASTGIELAATPAEPLDTENTNTSSEASSPHTRWRSAKSVEQIQRALADMGLYLGPLDGHLNDETRAAIRVYQEGAGLQVDGKLTRELYDLLNNNVKVRQLLRRLDKARKSSRDAAREALLAHPATRDLVDVPNQERADPTRNSAACFNTPTVRCLLYEASESAKAVFRAELRDWALGEILIGETRAGLTEAALNTARRIRDPRLIMVALRDIAEAEAASGRAEEAWAAAEIIPDRDKQADALAAIADIQIRRKENGMAKQTATRLIKILATLDPPLRRVALRSRAAVILRLSGDENAADLEMKAAEAEARDQLTGSEQGTALRYVASALAEMSLPSDALAVLEDITAPSERTSVLVSTAEAQARAGDAAAALATADTIETVRFKAAVLGRIAQMQAERDEREAAETTIELALAAVENIKSPFARSFAVARVALAMASLDEDAPARGEHDNETSSSAYANAAETAMLIDDNRLRARTLWAIAEAQRAAGDTAGALETERDAETATGEIISRLSRVWMLSEIALEHARNGKKEAAETAFNRGLKIAETVDNAWGRSRALARLATILVEVVNPRPALPREGSD